MAELMGVGAAQRTGHANMEQQGRINACFLFGYGDHFNEENVHSFRRVYFYTVLIWNLDRHFYSVLPLAEFVFASTRSQIPASSDVIGRNKYEMTKWNAPFAQITAHLPSY